MALISLKDYASMNNITYEAVRQQVVRYAEELADHIIKDGRQQFLDDEAVAFLDGKRQKNPVSIIQISKDEEIDRLREENSNLLKKIAAQADKISELSDWKADNSLLIAEAKNNNLLLEVRTQEAVAEAVTKLKEEFKEENERLLLQNKSLADLNTAEGKRHSDEIEELKKAHQREMDVLKENHRLELEAEKNKSWIQRWKDKRNKK